MRIPVLAAFLAMTGVALAQTVPSAPRFEDYAATERPTGRLAAPNYATSEDARQFRFHIDRQMGAGINFAGAYTIATWRCGDVCESIAVVDRRNGNIVMAPEAYNGIAFRRDSRLLVLNPPERIPVSLRDNPPAEMRSEFLVFVDGGFRRLDRDPGGWHENMPEGGQPRAILRNTGREPDGTPADETPRPIPRN